MKKIVIPTGKISSVLLAGGAVCASLLLDETLKKTSTGNKNVDKVGRTVLTSVMGVQISSLAALAWLFGDIEIPLKEKDKSNTEIKAPREKDKERFQKALSLWKELVENAKITKEFLDMNTHSINLSERIAKKDVKRFNELMEKLAKRINFEYEPLIVSDNISLMAMDIIASVDDIGDNILECYKYCYGHESYQNLITAGEEIAKEDAENNSDESDVEFASSGVLSEIFGEKDSKEELAIFLDLLDKYEDPAVQDILCKFESGDLTREEAYDYLIAYSKCGTEEEPENDADLLSYLKDDTADENEIKFDINTVSVSDELVKELAEHDIDPDDINPKIFSDIYQKFVNGELSAIDACNRIIELAIESKKAEEAAAGTPPINDPAVKEVNLSKLKKKN